MAKKKKIIKNKDKSNIKKPFFDERLRFIIGIIISGFALYLLISFFSYLIYWKTDISFSDANTFSNASYQVENWGGKLGHRLSKFFISYGFGLGSFLIPIMIGLIGIKLLKVPIRHLFSTLIKLAFAILIISSILSFGFINHTNYLASGPGGAIGHYIVTWLNSFVGIIGTGIIIVLCSIGYMIFALSFKPSSFMISLPKKEKQNKNSSDTLNDDKENTEKSDTEYEEQNELNNITPTIISKPQETPLKQTYKDKEITDDMEPAPVSGDMVINRPKADDILPEDKVLTTIDIQGDYDPRLDLSHYKFPPISFLKDYQTGDTSDDQEITENKDKIINCLKDFKISIKNITATVGPTVTLYEIIPDRGVKLSDIKSRENDMALNLKALGIRIIAPMPGRGTVGIEVPNKRPQIVTMKGLISSKAYQETKCDLPLALGRTITNDPYIVDLAKMPHLLVAGATGQGKSVGINTIIASLLYKKHPAELKLVLIDPKRVELSLYRKIEKHFLAKLPGEQEAIITDTQKVIQTLKSLCIEMDNRYELLKEAQVRAIKEYNEKFVSRKLNPEKGHRFLPYIVLIIDEFADLIMTAGKEIEMPIGRIAQLARAVGIHLIISTQRPSTNIITGSIKANFPTRIAFKVFSYIDSKTILDSSGAEQLVGNGDMLFTKGNEPIRLQCAFLDTPEIEEITEFIGSQQGYPEAYALPECEDEGAPSSAEVDLKKRDPLFDDAARLVVMHQQGSTSLIQRKMQLGYNRAGRIMDQLEAAGIVGPFEGSKAREVLYNDPIALEQVLKSLD